jgi:toxin ParE1/3/4
MTKPVYTSAARQDLVEILKYIARDKPDAAAAWVEKIDAKCQQIASHAGIGEIATAFGEGVRTNVVGRYVIFHRRVGDRTEILRVIAGDRDITSL